MAVVKGTSRRVIVVDSPDPELFEQAIFIVKNDVFTREGVTQQQLLGEACRIAKGYTGAAMSSAPLWKRIPWWGWCLGCGAAVCLIIAAALI